MVVVGLSTVEVRASDGGGVSDGDQSLGIDVVRHLKIERKIRSS